jgi:predicted sulfurtransferase
MNVLEKAGYTHVQNLLGGIAHYAQTISHKS